MGDQPLFEIHTVNNEWLTGASFLKMPFVVPSLTLRSAVARSRTSVHPGCPTPPPQFVSTSDFERAERLDSADCQMGMKDEIICGQKES
jgi:hypothetical protein